MSDWEYDEGSKHLGVCYDFGDEFGVAYFIRVCVKCGRFVKAGTVTASLAEGISKEPNATCSRCGPTHMLFEGFF